MIGWRDFVLRGLLAGVKRVGRLPRMNLRGRKLRANKGEGEYADDQPADRKSARSAEVA
jgi:hypothetical protein